MRSLLSCALLGGDGLGRGRSGSGCLNLDAHGEVLSCDSLFLTHVVLGSSGFGLGLEILLTDDLGLGFVDFFDQNVLVLEHVTLGTKVESVVHLAVNLLLLSISTKQTTKNTKTTHPEDLLGHTGVSGTLSLTGALMATLALGLGPLLASGARVSGNILSHDQSVLDQLPNVLACNIQRFIIKNWNQ